MGARWLTVLLSASLGCSGPGGTGSVPPGQPKAERETAVPDTFEWIEGEAVVRFSEVKCVRERSALWSACAATALSTRTPKVCGLPQGSRIAIFVLHGEWNAAARALDFSRGGLTPACRMPDAPAGVYAKCIDWGFPPTRENVRSFQACVRAATFDVLGDGTAHTQLGTEIDIAPYSKLGHAPGRCIEAGWTEKGAACLNHLRWQDDAPGQSKLPICDPTILSNVTLVTRSAPHRSLPDGGVHIERCSDEGNR
jgi:hypothetical protein